MQTYVRWRGVLPALAAAFMFALAAGAAKANDSSAVLGADGLWLHESDSVAMESEELRIGRDEIRVRYVFRNVSQTPVETLVAFPLPEINLAELSEVPVLQPSPDPVNFVDFSVRVDGQPVEAAVEQRAFLQELDVTEVLQGYGVPLTFFAEGFYDTLNALDEAARADLMQRQIAVYDEYAVYPQWSTETMFFWSQVFPPGKAVVIEHSYKPVVGQSFFGQYSLEEGEGEFQRTTFCIDESTEKGIRKRLDKLSANPDQIGYLIAYWTRYILKTGANWHGPIGRFHLTVDKGKPTALVSFCAEGVTKTGPTTFEVEKTNYVPDRDLDILILEEPEPAEPQ
jgi:hypothetical protein